MKTKKMNTLALPDVTVEEIEDSVSKSQTINIRVTPKEKRGVQKMASENGMSVSEYLLKCHALISEKSKSR